MQAAGDVSPERIARSRQADTLELKVRLAGDLDHILLKTLRKEPKERYGSVDYAIASANEHADQARRAISHFPDSEIKRALLWIPDFVVAREK